MALDSRQKRAAVIGVARAWYRNPHPSSMGAAQRASVGQVYPVATFSALVVAYHSIRSIIQEYGAGALSAITNNGIGVLSSTEESKGLASIIQSRGKGVTSTIDETGQSVESTI